MRWTSLFDGKLVRRNGVVALAGVQDHGREFRLIRRIRKVLCFQAEGGALGIGRAAFPRGFTVQKIPGVKLHPRLRSPNFHDPAGGGFNNASPRDSPEPAGRRRTRLWSYPPPSFS